LYIYPNPTTNNVIVNWDKQQNYDIMIYDINGKLVKSYLNITNNTSINVEMFNKGVYILELKNNKQTIRKKLVKQ